MPYVSRKEAKGNNVLKLNKKFIENSLIELKDYFDNMFKGIDDNIVLDTEQRIAILTDEDYNMIIAGAGSGKTTTLAAKVKYLVEIKKIDPKDILIISFTNKAVLELKDRINVQFNIKANICTFHKFGMDILKRKGQVKVLKSGYEIIKKYFDEQIIFDQKTLKLFLKFFGLYFKVPRYALMFDNLDLFHTFKSKFGFKRINPLIDSKMRQYKTINGEVVDCLEHVLIANFLYMNNIDYLYKVPYKKYNPTFVLNGEKIVFIENYKLLVENPNKVVNTINEKLYNYKIKQFRFKCHKDGIVLIETYANEFILKDLKKQLKKEHIPLKPKSIKEIYYQLTKDIYYQNFINFCYDFIKQVKVKNIDIKSIKTTDERSKLFLNLISKIYDYYQNYLNKNNLFDFDDMIIKAGDSLDKNTLNYKYIIIDEYQDISKERFNLAKKAADLSNAKVIAVGDDWQAIYAFSGSEVSLFTDFVKLMGYSSKLVITNTYRNSQELIDIAGSFVMKNKEQIKKQLKSPKHLKKPLIVYCYDNMNKALKEILDKLEGKILLIGRYNFEKNFLLKDTSFSSKEDKIFYKKRPDLDITFLSAHSSKGLGFDNVIVLNNQNDIYGFPSQVLNDPIIDLLQDTNDSILEERRLFYVALTRTKNYVYLLTPVNNPSIFIKEIIPLAEVINNTGYKIKN